MTKKTSLLLSTIGLAIGSAWWSGTTQAGPGSGPLTAVSASRAMAVTVAAQESKYSYVGSSKCKMCHYKQYKTWAKTKMATALNTLKPGQASDVKTKFGLDPNKDYSTDATCLKCHTTGYGHDGGYAIPDPTDQKAVKRAKKLANASCESCHGPGSGYIKIFMEIFGSRRKYKVDELYAAGLTKIDVNTCTTCHNGKGPTAPVEAFDFEKMKKKSMHEHFPLKQREK